VCALVTNRTHDGHHRRVLQWNGIGPLETFAALLRRLNGDAMGWASESGRWGGGGGLGRRAGLRPPSLAITTGMASMPRARCRQTKPDTPFGGI